MSAVSSSPNTVSTIRTRWQGPAFVFAIAFFALGVWRLREPASAKAAIDPRATIERLLASERYRAAAELSEKLLSDPDRRGDELAGLHRSMARALYLEARQTLRREPSVGREITRHYSAAAKLGAELGTDDRLWMGQGFVWQAKPADAAEAYRAALAGSPSGTGSPSGADWVRRQLVEWMADGAVAYDADEERRSLDGILDDDRSGPGNVAWALEHRVEGMLAKGQSEDALRIVRRYGPRLAGSPNRDMASYLEAACLAESGDGESAEAILRDLRGSWAPRDVLWAKVTWLLGNLNTRAGRPEVGLGFHSEVTKAFRSGPVYQGSLLGRAESLVQLERYDEAADALEEIVGLVRSGEATASLDRDAVRAFLQTSARLLEGRRMDGHAEDAVRYFEMSAGLLTPEDRAEAAFLHERIGDLHAALGREARERDCAVEGAIHADAAGDSYVELARVDLGDEARATRALWSAAEQYSAAGEDERQAAILVELAASYPRHPVVAAALGRLGQVNRRLKRFDAAILAYERLLREQPHTVDATQAVVPLAECLIAKGASGRAEATALLMQFIDQPPGSESLVTPQAPEYREAVILLAETLADDGETDEAISRFEKALGLYPEEPRAIRMRFRLAECYRRSAEALKAAGTDAAIEATRRERLGSAADEFGRVVGALGARDEDVLDASERAQLKSAYVQRADCLFDAGRFGEAAPAYAEVLWRYEAEPMSVPAALQIVHCNLRLGRRDEAKRGLERVRWLLGKIPAAAFERERAMPARVYWEELLERFSRSGLVS